MSMIPPRLPRRNRAPNYTKNEVSILFSLAIDEKSILENKHTDAVTWREKDQAWERIVAKFNANSPAGCFRNKESLRKLYEKKKKEIRRERGNENASLKLTGGGPRLVKNDPNVDLVMEILNKKTVDGFLNEFDSDSVLEMPEQTHTVDESDSEDVSINTDDITKSSTTPKDWGDFKSDHLKSSISAPLTAKIAIEKVAKNKVASSWSSRRRPLIQNLHATEISQQYGKLAVLKLEIAQLEKEDLVQTQKFKRRYEMLQIESIELDIKTKKANLDKILANNLQP